MTGWMEGMLWLMGLVVLEGIKTVMLDFMVGTRECGPVVYDLSLDILPSFVGLGKEDGLGLGELGPSDKYLC